MRQSKWKQIGVCSNWQCDERLWHAGLSEDGSKCFISGFEDHVYIVWDIEKQQVVWRDDGTNGNSEILPLDEWINNDGYISLEKEPAKGRYRIFGLNLNFSKIESIALGQILQANKQTGVVLVKEKRSGEVLQQLSFDAFSRDWAVASFSDNDSVIAVVEPYSVTFYGQKKANSNA